MIDSWSHGDWSPANPPLTHPFFASGEIEFMAHGAMGIRTPDLLNAIDFRQPSYTSDFTS